MLVFYNNYPTPAGATKSVCMGAESEKEEDYVFWAINNEYEVFSFSDPPQPPNSHRILSHLFVRNPVGKFCWENEHVLAMDLNNLPPSPYSNLQGNIQKTPLNEKSFKKSSNDRVKALLERFE